jgi:phosphoribosylaminoimidazolecarboxamide formyltransferase/IMP cyclohydrolase
LRALLSVADRTGITPFARELLALGVEVYATDGTRQHLANDGIEVAPISELTDFPPILGGMVKTFHPAVYGGIMARRDVPEHLAQLAEHGIAPIDIVAVNVKPFAPQVGERVVPIHEAVEMMDIGGNALLASAARNFAGVAAVTDPEQYPRLVEELRERGSVSAEFRQQLAAEAFAKVAAYDAEVSAYLNQIANIRFPKRLTLVVEKLRDLAYGENPHQEAAFYRETTHRGGTITDATYLNDAAPTFNNLLDIDVAHRIATDFGSRPTVAIVKQTNPVGLASSFDLHDAYHRALESDPVSAWGGVVALNHRVDAETAEEIVASSYEAVVAPGYTEEGLAILRGKPQLEIIAVPPAPSEGPRDYGIANLDFKRVGGGLLVETLDRIETDRSQFQVVTTRKPTLDELTDLAFAWRAIRHVTSNAIVLARHSATVGIGAGQANRTVAVEIALRRAADRARLAVMASDAYFPFADAIQLAAQAGVTAIIQPGGSARDEMAIEAADKHHVAMVFTGRRHFRH